MDSPYKLFINMARVLPVVGFPCLIATLVFSLQHAAVACSTVVLHNLNSLLIASRSTPLRAGCPSLSASAPLLWGFFVSFMA